MKYRDYYETLGVARDATTDQIKSAYRRLARKYHPDVSKEPDAEARFKDVGEAYDVLRDSDKRASYDQLGANWQAGQDFRPPPGWESVFRTSNHGGGQTGDPFSRFFEDLFSAQQRQARGPRPQAETLSVAVELEEAFAGAQKQVRLTDHGTGEVRTLKIKIPERVTDGQKIRLSGQGASRRDGRRDDLILELNIRPHRRFRVDGDSVYLDLPVAPWELALGAKVAVPTLGGTVDLTIPPRSRDGATLRLRGRGLGPRPGDQFVVLKTVWPSAETEEHAALYRQMAEQFAFDPRADW
ncbi:MAG: DnaJ C-terminal domain-containing protein [Pseudomonadota bacterium]